MGRVRATYSMFSDSMKVLSTSRWYCACRGVLAKALPIGTEEAYNFFSTISSGSALSEGSVSSSYHSSSRSTHMVALRMGASDQSAKGMMTTGYSNPLARWMEVRVMAFRLRGL